MREKIEHELTPAHKRMWHNKGVQDARKSLSSDRLKVHLAVSVNYWHPQHFADATKYYMLGFRRTGRRILNREQYQRAGIVG